MHRHAVANLEPAFRPAVSDAGMRRPALPKRRRTLRARLAGLVTRALILC